MKRYADLLAAARLRVQEWMPWDLASRLAGANAPMVLDVREPAEFAQVHIPGSINIPRGVLEAACDWDYEDTVPSVARARDSLIVVVCRSGNRSLLAADVMQSMGYAQVLSLKTGVRGWNDFEQPLVDAAGKVVDADAAQALLTSLVRPDQRRPA